MQIKRRSFLTLLGSAAAAWPLVVRAQQRRALPVIGWLHQTSPDVSAHLVVAFHQGLSEIGYVEGRNVSIEYRWAEGRLDRLPAQAADLVSRRVAVLAAIGGQASALAAKAATSTIPMLFITSDPVRFGFVASLNRPGGNATGVGLFNATLEPKKLQLLHELVPTATVIGVLVNPDSPTAETVMIDLEAAARTLGLQLYFVNARDERDFGTAFATLVQQRVGALISAADPLFLARREELVALAAHHALPTIYDWREFTAVGGLISYGNVITDAYHQAGAYAGRILKGEKPADLPVMQPVKFELVINNRTAKALGIEVPLSILIRVDEVIE